MTTEQRKANLICEIYTARFLAACKSGTDEEIARAEKRMIKWHRKCQEMAC